MSTKLVAARRYDVSKLVFDGWAGKTPDHHVDSSGLNCAAYFDRHLCFLGPDYDGVEPVFTADSAAAAELPNRYRAEFTGRHLGAIGVMESHSVMIEGCDEAAARSQIEERYQDIRGLVLTPVF